MFAIEDTVKAHYATLLARREQIMAAVAALQAKQNTLTAIDLAPFDQLHTGGAEATRTVIARLAPRADEHVLDVGSGLGGPARLLAHLTGARVTGIDLTPDFVETANLLSQETGQSQRVQFRQASALELPFPAETFDAAWHIHMSMNIADKPRLYAEIFRVLKPGGRFVLFDPVRGDARVSLRYPVPWSIALETSFLVTSQEMQNLLAKTGFAIESVFDDTAGSLAWFARLEAARAEGQAAGTPQPAALQDPRFAEMSRNHRANLQSGAVAIFGACSLKLT